MTWPGKWGERYPAVFGLWDDAWEWFIPFLRYRVEIWQVIWFTNAIESLKPASAGPCGPGGHFRTQQAVAAS